jgi:hypothetical protein
MLKKETFATAGSRPRRNPEGVLLYKPEEVKKKR